MGKIMIRDNVVVTTDLIEELPHHLTVKGEIFKHFQVLKNIDSKVAQLSICVEVMLKIRVQEGRYV